MTRLIQRIVLTPAVKKAVAAFGFFLPKAARLVPVNTKRRG